MMRYTTGCSSGVAQSGAAFYEEGDAVFWAQADGGVESHVEGCSEGWPQPPVACDGGEGEDTLHPGKAFADALTTAPCEWKEGEARARLCGLFGVGGETVGIEAERFRVEARVAVNDKLRSRNDVSRLDFITGDLVRLGTGADGDPDGRVETKDLGEDLGGVWEAAVVVGGGGAAAKDGDGFFVEASLNVLMLGKGPESEAECVRGGLVASEDDGQAFVTDLLVGHGVGGVFWVDGLEEHGEKIAAIAGVSAALIDHGINDRVEVGFALPDALHRWDGEALDDVGERHEGERKKPHERVDCRGDALNLFAGLNVKIEKASADDAEGELQHVVV
jgi:hypothetical protein